MKALCVLLLSALSATAFADSGAVSIGSKVRVQATSVGNGWLTGVLKKGGECTMVFLDKATPEGYTALALNALSALEVAQGTAWTKVDIKPLLAKETKDCREAAAD